MEAFQIDVNGRITDFEEEPTGPSSERIREIIFDSLNQDGYCFHWESNMAAHVRQQPLHGILSDGYITIDLLIYVWRITNEGKGRTDYYGKRIQIGQVDEYGFQRPITKTEKTLLLGVYERDKGFPIIAAWDVERNKEHGSSKSCFVKLNDFVKARKYGIVRAEDGNGNPVYTMTADYLAAFVEQIQTNATLNWFDSKKPPSRPDSFSKQVHKSTQKRAVSSVEAILRKIDGLSETEKQAVVNQRIGQGHFKDLLMAKYNGKCCICGLGFSPLLIGSHIKPWSESREREKLDLHNGLLLCVLHDALFDRFLISFEDNGQIIYSNLLSQDLLEFLNLTAEIRVTVSAAMKPYIQWHRKNLKRK